MVGSAVWRALEFKGYSNLIGKTSKELDLRTQSILPINSKILSQLATRPKNSCLNNQKLKTFINIKVPEWSELLENELQNL